MYSTKNSILEFKPCDLDFIIYNPYLKKVLKIINDNLGYGTDITESKLLFMRNDFVTEYSFTIPYYEILNKIAAYSPIVEIGAGSGYWARCITELGGDVIAYDSAPPGEHAPWEWYKGNSWFDDSWYNIIQGDESVISAHHDRTLFMAWPMPMSSMAYNTLVNYKNGGGKKIIYIGNPHPASSGDEYFYDFLYRHREEENIDLYSWPGITEKLLIYSLA